MNVIRKWAVHSQGECLQDIHLRDYSVSGLCMNQIFLTEERYVQALCGSRDGRYISVNNIKRYMDIYLSLGRKEEKTKNSVMSSVGDMTRKQYEMLKNNEHIKHTVLEWNNGGHFTNPEERTAKGIEWLYMQR